MTIVKDVLYKQPVTRTSDRKLSDPGVLHTTKTVSKGFIFFYGATPNKYIAKKKKTFGKSLISKFIHSGPNSHITVI